MLYWKLFTNITISQKLNKILNSVKTGFQFVVKALI